jgi:hypothetical protein
MLYQLKGRVDVESERYTPRVHEGPLWSSRSQTYTGTHSPAHGTWQFAWASVQSAPLHVYWVRLRASRDVPGQVRCWYRSASTHATPAHLCQHAAYAGAHTLVYICWCTYAGTHMLVPMCQCICSGTCSPEQGYYRMQPSSCVPFQVRRHTWCSLSVTARMGRHVRARAIAPAYVRQHTLRADTDVPVQYLC